MKLNLVNFKNYKKAIEIQKEIFPDEDGTLNILASLDRDLFMKKTGMFYDDDYVKYYIAFINDEPIGITGIYRFQLDEAWLAWFGILPIHEHKGYGEKLLRETMKMAKEQGYTTLRLYTDKVKNAKAIRLYEKIGFVGEKYSAEKVDYDCWIYSINLYNDKVTLWDNKNLNLIGQTELEQVDKQTLEKILKIYDELSKHQKK